MVWTGIGQEVIGEGLLVSIEEVKQFLRLSTTGVNTAVQDLIAEAEELLSQKLSTIFTVAQRVETLDGGVQSLRPGIQPVVSVVSVVDAYTEAEYLVTADFRVVTDSRGVGRIYLVSGGESTPLMSGQPQRWGDGPARWTVTHTAGYNNGSPAPKPVGSRPAPAGMRLGLLHLIRRMYESRGNRFVSYSGLIVNWDELAAGEITTLLAPYDLKEFC